MDTVIALRMFERILAVVIGGLSVYFGYRLFLKIPVTTTASGSVRLPSDITVVLSRVGPGVFFALFGVSVIALSFYQHVEYDEKRVGHGEQTKKPSEQQVQKFYGAAPGIVDPASDNRHDARMMLRRDIAILNTLPSQLNPSLSPQDRNLALSAIRRIKFELMKPVWGSDWGDQRKFEEWVRRAPSEPIEPELKAAKAYFQYPAKDDQAMTGVVCSLLLVLAALSNAPLVAKDFTTIYDVRTLEQWKPRYTASTQRIFNEIIRPWLTAEESRKLGNVVLDFPLFAEGEWRGQPLAFYTPGATRVILPVFSLKFLDDLCTSYAWLQLNGYAVDTVSEYTAMLAYGASRTGRYPSPMSALHIPADALQNKKVDELALDEFVTARLFILLHELGHIYSGKSAQNFAQSVQNEIEADAFAAKVMSRTPLPPLGMLVFFMADSSWAEYPLRPGTHPLSGSRVRALAKQLSDPDIAKMMEKLGELMDDPEVRASHVLVAKSTDESALVPRRGHLQNYASARNQTGTFEQAFNGTYAGKLVQDINPNEPMPIQFVLERNGDRVTGTYSIGLGVGIIEDGTVSGDMLNFTWRWGGTYGYGVMRLTRNGRGFAGTYGFQEASSGGGRWFAAHAQ